MLKDVFGEWAWRNSFVSNWCVWSLLYSASCPSVFLYLTSLPCLCRECTRWREKTIVCLYNGPQWEWWERMPHCSPSWLRNVALLTFDGTILLFGSCLLRRWHLRNLQTWHLAFVVTNSSIPRCRFHHEAECGRTKYCVIYETNSFHLKFRCIFLLFLRYITLKNIC